MSVKLLRNKSLRSLSTQDQKDFQHRLSDDDAEFLLNDWHRYARDEQLAPEGAWRIWLFLGGRGAGKTRSGAQWIAEGIANAEMRRVGLIGATYDDTRAIMIEGESGLLKASRGATFEPSNRRIKWSSGAIATVLSADEPDSLRGHQFDALWLDGDRAPKKSSHRRLARL